MSSITLFIFEGKGTEQNITANLCKYFINEKDKTLIKASYGFNIYKLFEELENDKALDIYELIVEELEKRPVISESDQLVLDIEDSENISDIYLFFDYDCHCTNANDKKLEIMLNRFNDAQGDGLLCISYPMVESIRHQKSAIYSYETYPTSDLPNYKTWVTLQIREGELDIQYQNWGLYTLSIWKDIINVNLARANQLTLGLSKAPNNPLVQLDIFHSQQEKHIPKNEVAVLSSFPLMLHDFYGDELTSKLTTTTHDK
jgi:hypothetical protein